ncbi:hypothetical protein J2Y03_004633 [Neobacillus niacini]|nr:hypothetical protein [Neobacillus niacini]
MYGYIIFMIVLGFSQLFICQSREKINRFSHSINSFWKKQWLDNISGINKIDNK